MILLCQPNVCQHLIYVHSFVFPVLGLLFVFVYEIGAVIIAALLTSLFIVVKWCRRQPSHSQFYFSTNSIVSKNICSLVRNSYVTKESAHNLFLTCLNPLFFLHLAVFYERYYVLCLTYISIYDLCPNTPKIRNARHGLFFKMWLKRTGTYARSVCSLIKSVNSFIMNLIVKKT